MHMKIELSQLELHRIENRFENVPHLHEQQFQITVPVRGRCSFTHENRHWVLGVGDGLVLHPRDRHSLQLEAGDGLIIIIANERGLHQEEGGAGREYALRQQFNPQELSSFFHDWAAGLFGPTPAEQMALEEKEAEALQYIRRLLGAAEPQQADHWSRLRLGSEDVHIRRVLEYIHDCYREQVSLDALAALALQSRYHFIRSFKSRTGQTPYQYVLRLRMEEAARLLRHSEETVTDIGFHVGFSSISPFYRIFSKFWGMSPEYYRQQYRPSIH